MNLGELLILNREPVEAEERIVQARTSLIEILGESHSRVAGATRYLATAVQQQGDFDRAEGLYFEALRMAELVDGGSRGALIARITAYLGDLASAQNRPAQAEELYRRALLDMELDANARDPRSELATHGVKRYPTLN